ncbi:MAG: hypothetical protein LBE91_20795, partial [Tannerella sp.]|nr:hypothetical protein [Tannerella sp.]
MRSLAEMEERVCRVSGFDIRMRSRITGIVAARQIFCYYARLEGYPLKRIAAYINYDHVTVLHSYRKVCEVRDVDAITGDLVKKYEKDMSREHLTPCPSPQERGEGGINKKSMSREKFVIEMEVPVHGDLERSVIRGVECPDCRGRGWNIAWDAKGTRHSECPRCRGAGKMKGEFV